MNPMQSQMGTPQMSEEELKKLAMLLQNMPAGEGIATVTPTEEDYMKDVFQSGKPLPGTEGLGPGGGMAKSFQGWDEGGGASGGDTGSNPSSGGSSSGGGDPYAGDRTGGAYGHRTETANAYSGGGIEAQDHHGGGGFTNISNTPNVGRDSSDKRERQYFQDLIERDKERQKQREAEAAAEEARKVAATKHRKNIWIIKPGENSNRGVGIRVE